MTSLQAALYYKERYGWSVIPVPLNAKAPRLKSWQNARLEKGEIEEHFSSPCNIGILLGEASNGLVDVDLDCTEAIALAKDFLPGTGMIFGRSSKPNSHWIYNVDTPPKKTLPFVDDERGMIVELRSTGAQTIFPPSVHVSAENICFRSAGRPAPVDHEVLEHRVRTLAIASLIARKWPSDGRHPLALGVGGFLARAGYEDDEIERIVTAICTLKSDPNPRDRIRGACDAAERVRSGESAYGLQFLAEAFGDDVARALRKMLPAHKGQNAGTEQHTDRDASSMRDRAIEALNGMVLWETPTGEGYATFSVRGHRENHRIRSRAFRKHLQAITTENEGRHMPKAAIDEAIAAAEAKAAIGGSVFDVSLRVASHDGCIYVDLGDKNWKVVRITAAGWSIEDNAPVKFIRPPGVKALPIPERGGTLDELRPLINVSDESDFRLFIAAMLAALIPDAPYPVLIISGEQGTAKTTLSRILKFYVDPHEVDARSPPRSEQDTFVGAYNAHVIVIDNVSHIPQWFSDTLCRLSTGGAFAARELYTDREEILIKAKRPMVLNGIPFNIERPDLLDRSIALLLPVIPSDKRRDEREYWSDVEAVRPRIFAVLLDALSTALQRVDNVQLPTRPRMADLARWITAAEVEFGWDEGTFVADFQARRTRSLMELANDVLVSALRDLVKSKDGLVEMTASELLAVLNARVAFQDRPPDWPRAPNRLSGEIRRLAPALREMGISVETDYRRSSDNNKLIVLSSIASKRPPQPELDIM